MNFYEITKKRQSCRKYDPSRDVEREALDRILAMTGERIPIRREETMPLYDRLFSVDAALAALGSSREKGVREAIRTVLSEDPETAALVARADHFYVACGVVVPACAAICAVSKENFTRRSAKKRTFAVSWIAFLGRKIANEPCIHINCLSFFF